MKSFLKKNESIANILFMIVCFVIALNLYNLFRFYGLEEMDKINVVPISFSEVTFNAFFGGIIVGTLIGIVDNILNRRDIRKRSFGIVVTLKTFSFLLTYIITISIVFLTVHIIVNKEPAAVSFSELQDFYLDRRFFSLLAYGFVVIFFINLIKQINSKMGPGNLLKFFLGRYHKPREEERIFMFLDLKSSTTIAENLGHIRFSRLLQDCFHDLTDVVKKYNAEIYQYVGDEVVLTWKITGNNKEEKSYLDCLHFYFAYTNKLNSRSDFYLTNYSVNPIFKAGINCGKVTVAEIGEIKSEIAFHGDVLNTAARIQSKCNELGKNLLISELIVPFCEISDMYLVENMGEISLRGKLKPISIFSVNKS